MKGLHSILTMNFVHKMIELQVGKGILLIFEMCAVIAWNRNSGVLSLLEITDIQQDAVVYSQGGRAYKHSFDRDVRLRSNIKYPGK